MGDEAALEGFEVEDVTIDGTTRRVYRAGSGPVVIVLSEVPGMTPEVIALARRLVDAGLRAVMPSLLGVDGKPAKPISAYAMSSTVKVCVSKEFTTWAVGRGSPITNWLRTLAAAESGESGGPVGVIGLCLTGGIALAMAVEPAVTASVMSQPSIPFAIGAARRRAVDISDADFDTVARRARDGELCVVGLRFTGDWSVPEERFATLRARLGDAFTAIEIPSGRGTQYTGMVHSVLAANYDDTPGTPTRMAFEQVAQFLTGQLAGRST